MIEPWQRIKAAGVKFEPHQRRISVPAGIVVQPYQIRQWVTGSAEPWQRVAVGGNSDRWQVIRIPS